MSDFHVRRGETATLGRVEGTLRVGNHARIEAADGKGVTIAGGAYFDGSAEINCNFECDTLESLNGKLHVSGDLTVNKRLDVGHSVDAKGAVKAQEIDVGGKIHAGSISCGRIRVGGFAQVDGFFEAASVEVGGKVCAPGKVKLGDLRAGGEVEVGGGSITGNIQVGGKFIAKNPLEFGELQVYGMGYLPANCRGRRISALGKVTVDGSISCDRLEVGGVVDIRGDCHAEKVEVGGKLDVSGSLFVSDILEGYGVAEIEGDFESGRIHTVGKFEAGKITVKEEADLSGKIETRHGMKARRLLVRSGTRCDGALIGEQVEVGKSADLSHGAWGSMWATKWPGGNSRVEDIYAGSVVLGPSCRAERIFADNVTLEQGCIVHQVTYTGALTTGRCVTIVDPPKKVTELPMPPF